MKSGTNWCDLSGKGVAVAPLPTSNTMPASSVATNYAITVVASNANVPKVAGTFLVKNKWCTTSGMGDAVHFSGAATRARIAAKIPDLFIDGKDCSGLHITRLSDPGQSGAVASHIAELSASKELALKFLESIGVATSDGRLTKAFGG